jgi:carbamoyl-phosphate synthase large subunit
MRNGDVQLVITTPTAASGARRDGYMMRRLAVELEIPFFTTINGAAAAVMAMEHAAGNEMTVNDLAHFNCGCSGA